jgi:hypothetical protein
MPVPIELSDTFTGTTGAAWDAMWATRNVDGASAAPTINTNRGRMVTDPAAADDDRIIAYLADTFGNFDLTVKFAVPAERRGQSEIGYRVGTNIATGTPTDGYVLQFQPSGGHVYLYKIDAYDYFSVTHGAAIDDALPHWFRLRVKGDRHRVKWWADGDDEPPSWNVDVTDATYTDGRIFLGTYNVFELVVGVGTWTSVTIDWDDFHLLEVLPPDPGFRVDTTPVSQIKIDDVDVVAAYLGDIPVAVTWP